MPRRAPTSRASRKARRYQRPLAAIMAGSAVRVARMRAGMSQAELAERVHTSQPTIARLEQGRVSPTVSSLERIAHALGAELVIDFEPVAPSDSPAARASDDTPERRRRRAD